jgi:hypothetical protein
MARESALWKRIRDTAIPALKATGHLVDLQRLENAVGTGHPDVEGCINGLQIWLELKSEDRPVRPTTPIHPKCRDSQRDWHRDRSQAGCRINWVLLQVGEGRAARLYLVPGNLYEHITAPESVLEILSVCDPTLSLADVLLRTAKGW